MLGDWWGGRPFWFFSIFQKRCFTDLKMYCYIFTLPPLRGWWYWYSVFVGVNFHIPQFLSWYPFYNSISFKASMSCWISHRSNRLQDAPLGGPRWNFALRCWMNLCRIFARSERTHPISRFYKLCFDFNVGIIYMYSLKPDFLVELLFDGWDSFCSCT